MPKAGDPARLLLKIAKPPHSQRLAPLRVPLARQEFQEWEQDCSLSKALVKVVEGIVTRVKQHALAPKHASHSTNRPVRNHRARQIATVPRVLSEGVHSSTSADSALQQPSIKRAGHPDWLACRISNFSGRVSEMLFSSKHNGSCQEHIQALQFQCLIRYI